MNKQRERLKTLITLAIANVPRESYEEEIGVDRVINHSTDYLLARGVIVPPCEVGDTVYRIVENGSESFIKEDRVKKVDYEDKEWILTLEKYLMCGFIGCNIFLTRDEAEQALKEWCTSD